ncbi:MAG: hypothetical protein DRO99_01365 [Candidatus Aenigmatarchaeota archaeon]|nr:MAG: hypothetical protein DRO99_01365 [Candidatus Aenigmarchaeota archaeon]
MDSVLGFQGIVSDSLRSVQDFFNPIDFVRFSHNNSAALINTDSVFAIESELIDEFRRITGISVLLNTSFNMRNEPIVETPEDAMRCF